MKVSIVLFDVSLDEFDLSDSYIIGCDKGALNAINSGNPKETFDKLWKMREQWYIDMKQPKYLNGWLKRLNRITFEY
jgi:hypothetical protein